MLWYLPEHPHFNDLENNPTQKTLMNQMYESK